MKNNYNYCLSSHWLYQTNKGNQLILAHIKAQDIQPLQYFLTQKLPQMIDTASPKADLASNLNKFSALIFEKLNLKNYLTTIQFNSMFSAENQNPTSRRSKKDLGFNFQACFQRLIFL